MFVIPQSWRPALVTWAWGASGAAACLVMAPLEPSLLEEGMAIHISERMLEGERLFRDVGAFTGALPFEVLTLLFRAFGAEIAVARVAVAVLMGAACGAAYALARGAGARAAAHVVAAGWAAAPVFLFPLLSIYYYATLALALTVLAAAAARRGLESPTFAVVAGLLVAAVALTKQSTGAVLALALLGALLACTAPAGRWRTLLGFAAGGAVLAVACVAFYAVRGDFAQMWRWLVVVPLSLGEGFGSALPNFWPPGSFGESIGNEDNYVPAPWLYLREGYDRATWPVVLLTQTLYALPFVALVATVLARLRGPVPAALWLNAGVLLSQTTNLFPRADWGHLVFALPPAWGQVCLLASARRGGGARLSRAVALLTCVALVTCAGSLGWRLYERATPPTFGPRVPQRPVSPLMRSDWVPHVVRYLREHADPGEDVFVARAEPLLYFATGLRNPTPFVGLNPGIREFQESLLLRVLGRIRYVVMSDLDSPIFNYYREVLPGVQAYLERHYRVVPEFTGSRERMVVLERGGDRGPALVDLFERDWQEGGGLRWIRDERDRLAEAPSRPPRLSTRQNRRPLPLWLGPLGGGIDFEVEVPAQSQLEVSIGMQSVYEATRKRKLPANGFYALALGQGKTFTAPIRHRVPHVERWTDIAVDLSAYAGRTVTLRLEYRSLQPLPPDSMAWYGSPRIAPVP